MKRLERGASEDLASFQLLDGSTYRYDRLETYRELFLHGYALQLGMGDNWPEPPEIFRKLLQAKDAAAALERFMPENSQGAFVNFAQLYDADILVRERRLVPLTHEPVEDLSG
jgi:hypothetical protein